MTSQPLYIQSIPIDVPYATVYRRLGYRRGITQISASQKHEIEGYIEKAKSVIELRGVIRRLEITQRTAQSVTVAPGKIFQSRDITAFLKDCNEIVLLGATAGAPIVTMIKAAFRSDAAAAGTVYDAVASEMTDAALSWLMDYCRALVRRERKYLRPKRFSCGYGDFSLKHQRLFFDLLHLSKIGVRINRYYILRPEKTVTALTGIYSISNSKSK